MLRRKFLLLLFAAAALIPAPLRTQNLPTAIPEVAGFSSERLAYIDRFFGEKVERGELAGMVILISRADRLVPVN